MKTVESTEDRFVRLLGERHHKITSSPKKAKEFLVKIGLKEASDEYQTKLKKAVLAK
jgi:hypothetical protein